MTNILDVRVPVEPETETPTDFKPPDDEAAFCVSGPDALTERKTYHEKQKTVRNR